jgi:hypothetical protein
MYTKLQLNSLRGYKTCPANRQRWTTRDHTLRGRKMDATAVKWPPPGFCPGLLECPHFFNQIQANNANLHYFMVRFNISFGWVVAFFAEWWSGPTSADRGKTLPLDWHLKVDTCLKQSYFSNTDISNSDILICNHDQMRGRVVVVSWTSQQMKHPGPFSRSVKGFWVTKLLCDICNGGAIRFGN